MRLLSLALGILGLMLGLSFALASLRPAVYNAPGSAGIVVRFEATQRCYGFDVRPAPLLWTQTFSDGDECW